MDFTELKAEILKVLDLIAEYEALGVKFTAKREANSRGWVPCYAVGRDDKSPSAAINLNSGTYKDQGGEGLCLSLFDFGVRVGAYADFKDAFSHYAKKAGLGKRLPKKWDGLRPEEKLDWCSAWNPLVCRGWLKKYAGTSIESLQTVGSRLSRYPARSRNPTYCLTWNVYGPGLLDAPARGYVIQSADGGEIALYQGEETAPKPTKRLVIGKSGLVGQHGLRLLQDGKAKRVFKVEGISDLITLQATIPPELRDQIAVITNAAGAGEIEILPEFAPLFSGVDLVIVHDSDEPGQNGAKLWLGQAGKYATVARNVVLHPGAIAKNHGPDLRDWLAEHSFADLQQLTESTKPFVTDGTLYKSDGGQTGECSSDTDEHEHDDGPGVTGDTLTPTQAILKRLGIVVLGHDRNGEVSIFTDRDGLVWTFKDVARLKTEHFVQTLGMDCVQENINLSAEPDPAKLTMKQVRIAIAAEANRRRIIDSKQIGVGAWEMNGRIGLVGAGQALLWNGGLVRTTVPFAEDRLMDFGGDPWFDGDSIERMLEESQADPEWCRTAFQEAIDLFARWDNWRHEDIPAIVAGLICCTWLQTVWPIRPLVAVSGPTNSGKSVFLDAVTEIFGKLALACAKPSEAGIRQNIGHTARILLIDEFEADWHRSSVLELFRTSTRGQEIVRGDAGQKGRKFGLKHIPWVGAIELGLVDAADQNRFIVLELAARDKAKGSQLVVPVESELRRIGQRLLVVAMRHWKAALAMLEPLRKESYGQHDLRLVEIYSVPVAMIAAVQDWDLPTVRGTLAEALDARRDATEIQSTEQELLEVIFDAECILKHGARETVGRMIVDNPDHESAAALERHGIKVASMRLGQGNLGLYLSAPTVTSKLLRNTKFKDMNVRQILERIPEAKTTKASINGKQQRCICIPLATIEAMTGESKTF